MPAHFVVVYMSFVPAHFSVAYRSRELVYFSVVYRNTALVHFSVGHRHLYWKKQVLFLAYFRAVLNGKNILSSSSHS